MAPPFFGINSDWWPTISDSSENQRWVLDLLSNALRFPVAMPPDLWGADQAVTWCRANEIRPYLALGGFNPAPSPDVYRDAVETYVRHYSGGPRVAFCLWNEPNFRSEWNPNPLPIEQTVELNLAGIEGARRADRNARVLGSSIGPHSGEPGPYFEELYGAIDGRAEVALHLYPGGDYEDRLDKIKVDYDLASRYGPVHVTEVDMAAKHLSDDPSKPQLAAKAYEKLSDWGARTIIFHSIDDHRAEAGALKKARRADLNR